MQNSKVARQISLPSTVKTKGSILMSIVLLGALLLVPATKANAQVECLGRCEQQLALCIAEGGRQSTDTCLGNYESCVNACLGRAARLLLG
jgi:hypothetical protein